MQNDAENGISVSNASLRNPFKESLSDGEKAEFGCEASRRDAAGALNSDSSILKHYLTFETDLPFPSDTYSGSENDESRPAPPGQPDLRKYTCPFLWSSAHKNYIIYVCCIATCLSAYAAGSYSEGAEQMSIEWGVSRLAVLVGLTTFCIGFAVAPMVLAPFSEINGRYPVFLVSGTLYFICQICCAVTRSYAGMILARFFAGCGSSVFSTMVGGVVSDLYHADGRNTPMALFSGSALFGTGLGPLVSGFIAQNTSWRWIFWLQVITCGTLIAVMAITFRETRASIILSRKAKAINAWYEEREALGYFGVEMEIPATNEDSHAEQYQSSAKRLENTAPTKVKEDGASESITQRYVSSITHQHVSSTTPRHQTQRIRWLVKSDEERASLSQMIRISVYRPFHLLTTEPVVFSFSLWVAFAWAVLYLTFGSIPLVFNTSHHFNTAQSGAIFSAMSIASLLSTFLSIYQEKLIRTLAHRFHWTKLLNGLETPEGRLYFACVESALLPIGLFWFGWTQFTHIPWIIPTLGIACATMGIYSVYLATFNYLADTYHRYASSALAAQGFCRNMLGGVFPLITTALFNNLGFAQAASLLGAVGAALTVVPWVLVWKGEWIRGRSRFASEIMEKVR